MKDMSRILGETMKLGVQVHVYHSALLFGLWCEAIALENSEVQASG